MVQLDLGNKSYVFKSYFTKFKESFAGLVMATSSTLKDYKLLLNKERRRKLTISNPIIQDSVVYIKYTNQKIKRVSLCHV